MRNNKEKRKKISKVCVGAAILAVVFLAGIFLFGGKAQGLVSGKLMVKGNHYFNGGAYDLDKAAKFYKVAAFVDRDASYPHYQLARVLFMKTNYKEALAEIDRALVLNPENKRAWYIRGLINGYDGDFETAAEDFQNFIAWAPKEWAGYNDLAWAYYEDEKYQEAAEAAAKGLEVTPLNAWLLNGLGVSLQALGKNDEAKVALDQSAELARNMTVTDWKRAYPGNDVQTADWDLAQFKTDVNYNLNLAASGFSLGKGKFQAACGASTVGTCSGSSCVLTTCDPDHVTGSECYTIDIWGNLGHSPCSPHPYPFCDSITNNCSSDIDCCADTSWTPTCGESDCSWTSCDGGGICTWTTHYGVMQTSNCGRTRCVSLPACPANSAPTGSIQHPKNEEISPGAAAFSWSFSDPDGDSQDGYEITGSCSSSGAHNSTVSSGYSSSSVTLGGFASGESCSWTLRVKDNRGGWSSPDSAAFTVASGSLPSCTLTCPDSVIVPPGETETFCTVSGSGCSMQSCTTQDDGDSIIDGSPGVSGNSCETAVKSSAGYESTAVVRARSNDGQTDDVTIFVRRLGWIEVNP